MAQTSKAASRPREVVWEAEPSRHCGPSDDLLTAGLGLAGLRSPCPPPDADARTRAIHKDFRDLVDVSEAGGFGQSYGPETLSVPGTAYSAFMRLPGRTQAFSVCLLLPDAFDWNHPLLIAAPSSGSRGVTGAIGDIGAWALPQGHALVLTDKGTGIGAHILGCDTAYGPDFLPTQAQQDPTCFRLADTDHLKAFRAAHPHIVALKHLHGKENSEADWPHCVLAAIKFGLYVLARDGGSASRPQVIAAGVSNGGGAVLRAAEVDHDALIHAVVAAEPNITPAQASPLFDYATQMNLYLPAALLASTLEDAPYASIMASQSARLSNWSQALGREGLIDGRSTQERAQSALEKIAQLGFSKASFKLFHAVHMMQAWPTISYAYANAYGRFGVEDSLLGAQICFADANLLTLETGPARAPTQAEIQHLPTANSGLTPGGGLVTRYANGTMGQSLDDALALRAFFTGQNAEAKRVQNGIQDITAQARNQSIATVIVHGEADPLIVPSQSSHAYFSAAKQNGQDMTHWRLYRVEGAQHFETLLMDPEVAKHYRAQLPFFHSALKCCKAFLAKGAPLPPSQTISEGQSGLQE
ncbi:MAG: 3-hydroxybutyrate oligomer hydrolase family protein [Sphingomonadales bacterium]